MDKYFETSGAKSSGQTSKPAILYIGRGKNNNDLLDAFKLMKEKKLKNANE